MGSKKNINNFCEGIEKLMDDTLQNCKDNFIFIDLDKALLLSERYGIYTHQQYLLLILEINNHLDWGKYQPVRNIIDSIINDKDFQKAGLYWADVQRYSKYRSKSQLSNSSNDLGLLIKKALEMRTTENQSEKKLLLVCLGWLIWMEKMMPCLKLIMSKAESENLPYLDNSDYFIIFPSLIKNQAEKLKKSILYCVTSDNDDIFDAEQWKEFSERTLEDIRIYNTLMFKQII